MGALFVGKEKLYVSQYTLYFNKSAGRKVFALHRHPRRCACMVCRPTCFGAVTRWSFRGICSTHRLTRSGEPRTGPSCCRRTAQQAPASTATQRPFAEEKSGQRTLVFRIKIVMHETARPTAGAAGWVTLWLSNSVAPAFFRLLWCYRAWGQLGVRAPPVLRWSLPVLPKTQSLAQRRPCLGRHAQIFFVHVISQHCHRVFHGRP